MPADGERSGRRDLDRPGGEAQKRYLAADLFGAHREIEIVLDDAIYRLRWTKSDKLILNK